MEMRLHRQNFMLAVRQQMGWPLFRPANDCICFAWGRPPNLDVGTEIARIAQTMRKDFVYTGWADTQTKEPASFTVAFRQMLNVDVVERLAPYAADDETPILLVSTRADEFFTVDGRGSLIRVAGKPSNIATGRKLAMKRISMAASTMRGDLLAGNRCVPTGGDWIEPEAPVQTIVRFG
ncbi:MAG: hypothetical protein KGJ57_00070 [Sphingomonadales bacterium]|nr:hypothetical protein [Sphingomonadales bacterium]MDE2167803.1 hypothetical protein [Sphingomonadales bacterium]